MYAWSARRLTTWFEQRQFLCNYCRAPKRTLLQPSRLPKSRSSTKAMPWYPSGLWKAEFICIDRSSLLTFGDTSSMRLPCSVESSATKGPPISGRAQMFAHASRWRLRLSSPRRLKPGAACVSFAKSHPLDFGQNLHWLRFGFTFHLPVNASHNSLFPCWKQGSLLQGLNTNQAGKISFIKTDIMAKVLNPSKNPFLRGFLPNLSWGIEIFGLLKLRRANKDSLCFL